MDQPAAFTLNCEQAQPKQDDATYNINDQTCLEVGRRMYAVQSNNQNSQTHLQISFNEDELQIKQAC